MKKTQTKPWDPAENLETVEDMATLGDIARARRMSVAGQKEDPGRENLYTSLSTDGNPEFGAVLKAVRALGLRLQATAVTKAANE